MKSIFQPIALLWLLYAGSVEANVKVASIFGSHMVLQRETDIPVWGTAAPGELVMVSLGDDKASGVADQDGKWKVKLAARSASDAPLDLMVAGRNTIVLHDVLVGDVWLASGQSNMDWAFFWGHGVLHTDEEMAAADYPLIRDCKVRTSANTVAQEEMAARWIVCTPKPPTAPRFSSGIENFTAVGYFFARELYRKLKIPIGLINSSDGGTQIETWLDPDTARQFPLIDERWQKRVAAYPEEQARYDAAKAGWDKEKEAAASAGQTFKKAAPVPPSAPEHNPNRPSAHYNAMIHPFLGYAFKGAIWYQGENNVGRAEEYQKLFPALIEGWRREFGLGDFPFYWAQLSNYNFQGRPNGIEWAASREAQTMTLAVPKTGQAITLDIGDAGDVHLHNKQEVGRRLALLALARSYGIKDVVDSGPVFDHADLKANPVKVYFQHAEGGLKQMSTKDASFLGGFELAGADRLFHPAEARIDANGGFVLVTCPDVSNPVALRYAWRNNPKNLALGNGADLPAAPFRTDTWAETETAPAR